MSGVLVYADRAYHILDSLANFLQHLLSAMAVVEQKIHGLSAYGLIERYAAVADGRVPAAYHHESRKAVQDQRWYHREILQEIVDSYCDFCRLNCCVLVIGIRSILFVVCLESHAVIFHHSNDIFLCCCHILKKL